MNCDGYHLTVGLSCSSMLSVYLFRFQLYLLFVFATMIMVNKDYHKIKWIFYGSQCTQSMLTTVNVGD